MTHAPKKSFRDFKNTEHAGYGAKHHYGAGSLVVNIIVCIFC